MDAKCYAVITADIVDSRKTESFTRKRDRILGTISTLHLNEKLTISPYTITAWDEFEVILSEPAHMPRVILDIRRSIHPAPASHRCRVGHSQRRQKTSDQRSCRRRGLRAGSPGCQPTEIGILKISRAHPI